MRRRITRLATVLLVLLASTGIGNAQPSANLEDYALFAERQLKTKGLHVFCGSVGVNQDGGQLRATNLLTVSDGDCVADTARLVVPFTCNQLYANVTFTNPPVFGTMFTPPVIADVADACDYPDPFPACDLLTPVDVAAGTTTSLPPGTYGNVTVRGYFDTLLQVAVPGILELQGGNYNFCNLKLGRYSEVRVQAASDVNVNGILKMAYSNYFGPDGGGLGPEDIRVFVNGSKAHYSRYSTVSARLCAPAAKCRLTAGGTHFGAVWCDTIRTELIDFSIRNNCASPSGAFVD